MRQTFGKIRRNVPFWLMTLFYLVSLMTETGEGQQQTKPARGYNPKINIGEFPPDFELPKLTLKTDEAGKPIGVISEKETTRLSSFRGKKPVCLIMSSYT